VRLDQKIRLIQDRTPSLQTSPRHRIKNLLIYAHPSLVLCKTQRTLPLRVLQETVLPRIYNTALIEESDGILIQALADVLSDALECRENQVRPPSFLNCLEWCDAGPPSADSVDGE
jgi:hypothetical protein